MSKEAILPHRWTLLLALAVLPLRTESFSCGTDKFTEDAAEQNVAINCPGRAGILFYGYESGIIHYLKMKGYLPQFMKCHRLDIWR